MRVYWRHSVFIFVLCFGAVGCHKAVPSSATVAAAIPVRAPALPPTIELTADRSAVAEGQAILLTWRSTNADTVILDNNIGTVANDGSRSVIPSVSTSYTATARGQGGTAASAAVRVTVNAVPRPATTAAQPAPPVRVPTLEEQFRSAMQNVLFDYDESALRATEFAKLETASQFLLSHPQVRIRIEGNADERGGQEYNIALGDERADAVRKYLLRAGVGENRLETLSYGEERPLCADLNEDCWQRNRRAQFVIR